MIDNTPSNSRTFSKEQKQWRRLLLIAISGSAIIATPQLAHAALTENPPASGQYTASGAEVTTQSVSGSNIEVTTDATFSVNTNAGNAVSITGNGALSYTDTNAASLVTTGNAYALNVDTSGNAPDTTPGSITITSNGDVSGGGGGVRASNNGTGSVTITLTGTVTSQGDNGINVVNGVNAANVEIEANEVTGANFGIAVTNNGLGSTEITTNGAVTGTAQSGIRVYNSTSTTSLTVTANDDVSSTGNNGIDVENNGTGNTTVTAGNVSGLSNGIAAQNHYGGDLTITSTGTITATNQDGVNATNTANTGDLTVNANIVTAGNNGINTSNAGTGDTSITATGAVNATAGNGINAVNGAAANDLTVTSAAVTGGQFGIATSNSGTGDTTITTNGIVTGTGNSGIRANNATTSTGALTVTANANVVSNGNHGIDVENSGTGNTTVTAGTVNGLQNAIQAVNHTGGDLIVTSTGTLTGTNNSGVNATNTTGGVNLTVTTNTVTGGQYGIITSNSGTGDTTITTNGVVTSTGNSGIRANNATTSTGALTVTANANVTSSGNHGIDVENTGDGNTTVTAGNVSGLQHGIHAVNRTDGDLSVTSTGTITATNQDGVNATNEANTGNLTVTVNTVTGGRHGVNTLNNGEGTTTINVNNNITGTSNNAVNAVAGATAGSIDVNIASGRMATGGAYGVATSNSGIGTTTIDVGGLAQGGTAGILANSSGSQAIEINVTGEVRNSSTATSARAISSTSGVVTINNSNVITGTVSLGNQGNTFNNAHQWNSTGGTSTLGTGANTFNNELSGIVLATAASGGASNTTVNGVSIFSNTGAIMLQNQYVGGFNPVMGDVLTLADGGSGEFQSDNGTLYIDTDLENGTSDRIAVDNVVVTGGATTVHVNHVGPGRATSGDGILVVDVDGTSESDAFVLSGPIQVGLFDYNLGQGNNDTQSWFLQSSLRDEVVSAGALSVLGSRTALATLSNLSERQRGGETFSDDQDARKGVWARAFGQDAKFRSDGGSNAGFNANTWGAQAGLDLVASESEKGARKYAGVYVGYATSNGDALNGSSRVGRLDVDATSVGAYFTKYSPKGWYADATAQFSKLDGIRIRTDENSLNPDGKSYAASLEFGQRFNLEKKLIPELQAQLIYQKTDIDDVTLSDSTRLNIGDVNAVTGRLGVRLSKNPAYAGRMQPWVRANLWHTLKTGATVSSQGATSDTRVGGTSGEVQVGFALTPSQSSGWSAYVAGGYLFDLSGSEYSGWKGTLGVRKGW